jgi:ankyrin repeat protein
MLVRIRLQEIMQSYDYQQDEAEAVALLIDAGADDYNAALQNAATFGYTEVLTLLIDAGADVAANEHKALRLAAECGRVSAVNLLLERGSDPAACDHEAIRLAESYGYQGTVTALINYTELNNLGYLYTRVGDGVVIVQT